MMALATWIGRGWAYNDFTYYRLMPVSYELCMVGKGSDGF